MSGAGVEQSEETASGTTDTRGHSFHSIGSLTAARRESRSPEWRTSLQPSGGTTTIAFLTREKLAPPPPLPQMDSLNSEVVVFWAHSGWPWMVVARRGHILHILRLLRVCRLRIRSPRRPAFMIPSKQPSAWIAILLLPLPPSFCPGTGATATRHSADDGIPDCGDGPHAPAHRRSER